MSAYALLDYAQDRGTGLLASWLYPSASDSHYITTSLSIDNSIRSLNLWLLAS